MDIKKFKLLKEHADQYEIQHPSGRAMQVSKKGLSEKAHAIIKKLGVQHFDDGGMVLDADKAPDFSKFKDSRNITKDIEAASQAQQGNKDEQAIANFFNTDMAQQPPAPEPTQPVSVGSPSAPAASPAPMPAVDNSQSLGALQQAEGALKGSLGQTNQIGQQMGQVSQDLDLDAAKAQAQAAQDRYAANEAKYDQERVAIENNIRNGKIDPDRVINNMSTGTKFLTGIGMLFSGLGSGLTGQKNMAVDALNRHIDADIDAQKNEQSKNMNLWKMNRENSASDLEASLKTRAQYLNLAQAKLSSLAAQSQNQMQKDAAARGLVDIEKEMQGLKQQTLAQQMLSQQGASGDAATKIRLLGQVGALTPDQQKQAYTELDKDTNLQKQSQNLLSLFDKAKEENTILKTGAGLLRTPASVSGFMAAVMPYLKDAEGRINTEEIKIIRDSIPKPGDTDAKIAEKRENLANLLQEKSSSSFLRGLGIVHGGPVDFTKRK